jgi:hypothetical protein
MLMTGILDNGLHSDFSMNMDALKMDALKKPKQVPVKVLIFQAAIVTMKNAMAAHRSFAIGQSDR